MGTVSGGRVVGAGEGAARDGASRRRPECDADERHEMRVRGGRCGGAVGGVGGAVAAAEAVWNRVGTRLPERRESISRGEGDLGYEVPVQPASRACQPAGQCASQMPANHALN